MTYDHSEGYPLELKGYYFKMDISIYVVIDEYENLI